MADLNGFDIDPFSDSFWATCKQNYKNKYRNDMRTSDAAFER
eukprot:UN21413